MLFSQSVRESQYINATVIYNSRKVIHCQKQLTPRLVAMSPDNGSCRIAAFIPFRTTYEKNANFKFSCYC